MSDVSMFPMFPHVLLVEDIYMYYISSKTLSKIWKHWKHLPNRQTAIHLAASETETYLETDRESGNRGRARGFVLCTLHIGVTRGIGDVEFTRYK